MGARLRTLLKDIGTYVMKALLVRKPGWGVDFGKAVNLLSTTIRSVSSKKRVKDQLPIINWGANNIQATYNTREAIAFTSNKRNFRMRCMEEADLAPRSWDRVSPDITFPVIVRKTLHKQGKDLYLCNNNVELDNAIRICGPGYYISEYIQKKSEYRVYVVDGRVAAVSEKIPEDREAVAWNIGDGVGKFVNVRWDRWPIAAVDCALRAFRLSGLHFGGVDVIVGEDKRAYTLEINTAIALPFLEGDEEPIHRISYNQKVMVKCLEWMVEGKDPVFNSDAKPYHNYIHAAVKL
jgi:hypothetical protein